MLFVDFLAEGSPDCPLLRIFGTDQEALHTLHRLFQDLGNGLRSRVDIHQLEGFTCQAQVQLTCLVKEMGSVVEKAIGSSNFAWSASQLEWMAISDLVQPLFGVEGKGRFQWLVVPDVQGSIGVLLSVTETGEW
jgi:hypothetical protein